MLLIKRLLTAFILGIFLFFVLFVGAMVVGGAVIGATSAVQQKATDFESGAKAGQEAGREFGHKYGQLILIGSATVAVGISLGISFSRLLPWCRPKTTVTPPPLRGA